MFLEKPSDIMPTVFLYPNHAKEIEYTCPTSRQNNIAIILDINKHTHLEYGCPSVPSATEITLPQTNTQISPITDPLPSKQSHTEILAKKFGGSVMEKRRRKMKQHQRRKWKQRNLFLVRQLQEIKHEKRVNKQEAKIKTYKTWAEDFDALKFIKEEINMARKSGFETKSILSEK